MTPTLTATVHLLNAKLTEARYGRRRMTVEEFCVENDEVMKLLSAHLQQPPLLRRAQDGFELGMPPNLIRWCPEHADGAEALALLVLNPGRWVSIDRVLLRQAEGRLTYRRLSRSRRAWCGVLDRAVEALRVLDPDLAARLTLRPGTGPGVHLRNRDGRVEGLFIGHVTSA